MRLVLSALLLTAAMPVAAQSSTEPAAKAPPPTVAAPGNRIICHTDLAPGSIVKRVRRCGTVEEWRKSMEAAQYTTNKIQEQKGALVGH